MKVSLFFLALSSFFGCSAFGITLFDTPIQPLKKGHFSTGLEYVHSKVDVETESAALGPITLPATKIKDVELDRTFFLPSYGVFDFLTVYGRIGLNRMDVDAGANRNNFAGQQGTSDWDFTAGGGARAVLYKKERFLWLASGLFTWTDLDGFNQLTAVVNNIPVNGNIKVRLYDYQFSTGPAYEFVDGWLLSAGPYLQFIDGHGDVRANAAGNKLKTTIDVDEVDYFGGYLSSQLQLTEAFSWNVRFSATGSGYTIATGVTVAF
ncbi:MAG: hypothetical protein A2178_02325 [Planctomycetes bacterium GWC2_49_10]|nr:MAG: hypothetical protein A2178_02325 [Planctomycetes bacterium GWC2_49_10]